MRFSMGEAANLFAWTVILGLICAAGLMVVILGPFGLILLGLVVLFVCSQFSLNEEAAGGGLEVLKARLDRSASPEQRAAMLEQREENAGPLRFYRWYGAALLAAGVLGFAWQVWR
jgi:hypothetical protein